MTQVVKASPWDTYTLRNRLEVFHDSTPYKMFSKGISKNKIVWIVPCFTGFGTCKSLIAPLLLKCFHHNGGRCDRSSFAAFRSTKEVFTVLTLKLLLHKDNALFEIHIFPG